MITALILIVILDVDAFSAFLVFVVLADIPTVIVVIIRLQTTLGLEIPLLLTLGSEASACLSHLVEEVISTALLATARLRFIVIIEDLLVLRPLLVLLQILYHLLVLLPALHLLQVVLVQFVLEVVDVREFLHVNCVETL